MFSNTKGETGHSCVAAVTDMSRAVMSIDYANENDMFAFGCSDGYLRVMGIQDVKDDE